MCDCQGLSSEDVGAAAHAAVEDGTTSRLIGSLSSIGQYNGNASRGLGRCIAREGLHCNLEPYVSHVATKVDGKLRDIKVPVILPHETVNYFYTDHPDIFNERFIGSGGAEGLEAFWREYRHTEGAREHPGWELVEAGKCVIPLRLHGDTAPVTNKYGMLVMNFVSCMIRDLPSELSRNLICVHRYNLMDHAEIWDILSWSMMAHLKGQFPDRDHRGNPLTWARAKMANKPIAGNFHFLFIQCVGDWKWYKDNFGLESVNYSCVAFCWKRQCLQLR